MIFGEQTNKYILFIAFYKIIKSISQLLLRGKSTSTKKVNDDQLPAIFDEINRPEIEREVTCIKPIFRLLNGHMSSWNLVGQSPLILLSRRILNKCLILALCLLRKWNWKKSTYKFLFFFARKICVRLEAEKKMLEPNIDSHPSTSSAGLNVSLTSIHQLIHSHPNRTSDMRDKSLLSSRFPLDWRHVTYKRHHRSAVDTCLQIIGSTFIDKRCWCSSSGEAAKLVLSTQIIDEGVVEMRQILRSSLSVHFTIHLIACCYFGENFYRKKFKLSADGKQFSSPPPS